MADSNTPSKPTVDIEHDALLREVDEDLRHEQFEALWKKYGNLVIGAALLVVVGVAGYQAWRHFEVQARLEQGRGFAAAQDLLRQKDDEGARLAFAEFAAKARPGYALLARFQEAAIQGRKGDVAGAIATYRKVAGDASAPALYRDLATLLGVELEMDTGQPAELMARLAPLTADGNPWRFSARELTGVLAMASGDKEKARGLFQALSQDAQVPAGIGARAAELLSVLGS